MYDRLIELGENTQTDPKSIIPEDPARVVPYLQAIDVLWLLGDREGTYGATALR
jgi:hypothetical protein